MATSNKDKIRALLKSIETGDPDAVAVVNEAKYVQHNPQTREGSEGLAALFKRLSATNPRVNVVRAFEDGDFVFGHTEYDFATRRIGFEVFRFEDGQAVEHWDNIQPRQGPNAAGRSMVDGADRGNRSRPDGKQPRIRAEFCGKCAGRRPDQPTSGICRCKCLRRPQSAACRRCSGATGCAGSERRAAGTGGSTTSGSTGSSRKAISYSASAKGMPMASILPFTTCSASPAANWRNTGTRPKRSRRRANGRTITGSFEGLFTARARH